jgi:hypothetical protein
MGNCPVCEATLEKVSPAEQLDPSLNLTHTVQRLVDRHAAATVIRAVLAYVEQRREKAEREASAARKALEDAKAAMQGAKP